MRVNREKQNPQFSIFTHRAQEHLKVTIKNIHIIKGMFFWGDFSFHSFASAVVNKSTSLVLTLQSISCTTRFVCACLSVFTYHSAQIFGLRLYETVLCKQTFQYQLNVTKRIC